MRISDWSSDVCSSDLTWRCIGQPRRRPARRRSRKATTSSCVWRNRRLRLGRSLCLRHRPQPPLIDGNKRTALLAAYVFLRMNGRELVAAEAEAAATMLALAAGDITEAAFARSEEHTSELQSLMRTSYPVFCL